MFSFTHIAIVFLVALLVFGPEKLPEVARVLGKALGDFRKASIDFRRVVEQEFAEIERQAREKEELARQKAQQAAAADAGAAPGATEPSTSAPDGSVVQSGARPVASNLSEAPAPPADGYPS